MTSGTPAAPQFAVTDPSRERAGESYISRRKSFLGRAAEYSGSGRTGIFSQVARRALGRDIDPTTVEEALAIADERWDSSDFTVAGMVRLLGLGTGQPGLDRRLAKTLTAYRYWWDEPGDHGSLCYHTENHQALFHSTEIAAAALLPGERFGAGRVSAAGRSSRETAEHGIRLLKRWMALRARVGWSEWLSNTYTEHNVLALLTVVDYAPDAELRLVAGQLVDLILLEITVHSHDGTLGSTHGRAYSNGLLDGHADGATTLLWLATGRGRLYDASSVGAVALATSSYRPPQFLETLASTSVHETIRERQGFDISEAGTLGLGFESEEDGHVYWAMQEFMHPLTLPLTRRLVERYALGLDREWRDYAQDYANQVTSFGHVVDPLRDIHALSGADIQTHKRPGGTLSSVQSFRPGSPGYQHHVWQATLGPRAVVFTTHPGSWDTASRPSFFAGNGTLPRATQHENVLICQYRLVPEHGGLPFTHAWFPTAEFDEISTSAGWWCGRAGTGYVALWSARPVTLINGNELRAQPGNNAWVCEFGDNQDGSFAAFVDGVTSAEVSWDAGAGVSYNSSFAGAVTVDWDGPLLVDGAAVEHTPYPRFDSPIAHVMPGALLWNVGSGDQRFTIDLRNTEDWVSAESPTLRSEWPKL